MLNILIMAVNLTCVVPTAEVARAQQLCEVLRVELRVKAADWNNNQCATEFLRRGLREFERTVTERAERETATSNVRSAVQTFDTNFPPQVTTTRCGDGVTDAEFGEQCDDGNTVQGDGCDSCILPPP